MSDFETYQSQIKSHAILMSVGFLILLPLGILLPRYTRTFTNKWFYGHVGFQLLLAGPIIIAGFALGVHALDSQIPGGGMSHFSDRHTKVGLALFILYLIQVLLGVVSHSLKRPSLRFLLHRTPHQFLHIPLGLTIVFLAFYQVHLGYTFEGPAVAGLVVPSGVDKAWLAWVIIIPILYVAGFGLLPRQISQESSMRSDRDHSSEAALKG